MLNLPMEKGIYIEKDCCCIVDEALCKILLKKIMEFEITPAKIYSQYT
jgi:hypothetical protein